MTTSNPKKGESSDNSKKPIKIVNPAERFRERESKELIIGFSGPVGSGVNYVVDETEKALKELGYETKKIKLSSFIKACGQLNLINFDSQKAETPQTKYDALQDGGNRLRERYQNPAILAELAITAIALDRTSRESIEVKNMVPGQVAYLIDQLKRPEEVEFLRTVYGDLFYLIGVFSSENSKKRLLKTQLGISDSEAEAIMERDKRENLDHGQQLEKTLQLADLFVRNSKLNNIRIRGQLNRFFKLIHGYVGVSPTMHEYAMYAAYSSGLRSACLSRAVGACITDSDGNILATGCNDVPKANGGLYTDMDNNDQRCIHLEGGKCFNDYHKNKIRKQISQKLSGKDRAGIPDISIQSAEKLSLLVYEATGLKDLIEFSRSVHAEMDALLSVSRMGGVGVKNGLLYCTTYPCHSCARHIIAAGISRVYYIEPYEKSLAKELHGDAIEADSDEEKEVGTGQVQFLHFEGVSPRQYQNFFYRKNERKDKRGNAIFLQGPGLSKVKPQLLDDYRSLESKVTAFLQDQGIDRETLKVVVSK